MVSFSILATRWTYPRDFALFPKLKMKLKGLHSIKENDFHGAFEAW
jgi:hypothetical protein